MKLSTNSPAAVPAGRWPQRNPSNRSRKNKNGRQERARDSYEIRSVANALDLLEAICTEEGPEASGHEDTLRVSHLSQRLGISKGSVFRLLATFESRGYVERIAGRGIYRIGVNAYETGRRLLLRMRVLRHARPIMEDLSHRCNEAVYLAVRRGGEFLFIEMAECFQPVKVAPMVGKRFPLTDAAPGKVLLAFADSSETQPLVAPPPGIRHKGYLHEQNGLGDMVSCLAAPLFNSFGAVAGALCVVGPSFRMPAAEVETALWPILKDCCNVISSKLGYLKPYSTEERV